MATISPIISFITGYQATTNEHKTKLGCVTKMVQAYLVYTTTSTFLRMSPLSARSIKCLSVLGLLATLGFQIYSYKTEKPNKIVPVLLVMSAAVGILFKPKPSLGGAFGLLAGIALSSFRNTKLRSSHFSKEVDILVSFLNLFRTTAPGIAMLLLRLFKELIHQNGPWMQLDEKKLSNDSVLLADNSQERLSESEATKNKLSILPQEILYNICSFCNKNSQLNIRATSSRFKDVINSGVKNSYIEGLALVYRNLSTCYYATEGTSSPDRVTFMIGFDKEKKKTLFVYPLLQDKGLQAISFWLNENNQLVEKVYPFVKVKTGIELKGRIQETDIEKIPKDIDKEVFKLLQKQCSLHKTCSLFIVRSKKWIARENKKKVVSYKEYRSFCNQIFPKKGERYTKLIQDKFIRSFIPSILTSQKQTILGSDIEAQKIFFASKISLRKNSKLIPYYKFITPILKKLVSEYKAYRQEQGRLFYPNVEFSLSFQDDSMSFPKNTSIVLPELPRIMRDKPHKSLFDRLFFNSDQSFELYGRIKHGQIFLEPNLEDNTLSQRQRKYLAKMCKIFDFFVKRPLLIHYLSMPYIEKALKKADQTVLHPVF